MTKASDRQPQAMTLDGGPLGTLAFTWRGDRYCHTWMFDDPQSPRHALLESIESDSTALWPVSPPLQQIHQQEFDDGREVIFGVGMSGRGHWSASFTLVPDLNCWIVELACRSPLIPESLSCAYQLLGQWQREGNGAWQQQIGDHSVRIEPISPSSLGHELPNGRLHISPAQLPTAPPSTTQWAFRLKRIG